MRDSYAYLHTNCTFLQRSQITPKMRSIVALRPAHCAYYVWMMGLVLCASAQKPKQLAPTVMINGFGDLEGSSSGSSLPLCQLMLQRARPFSDTVSFALAVFPMAPDKFTLESWSYKDAEGKHVAASSDSIARWQRGLQACFAFAIAQGFKTLHILGHWDPVHPVLLRATTWRNLMDIRPRQEAQGLTYEAVMIRPVIAAANAVASPQVQIWFSVSGEMGLSNFLYSRGWQSVLTDTRQQLLKKPWQAVKVATALNFQMFCGCVAASAPNAESFDPLAYNQSFAGEFAKVKRFAVPYIPDFQALLAANDFIGVSAYGTNYPASNLSWADMELPMYTLAYELRLFGIDLPKLTANKPVLFVEQGLGGVFRYGLLPAPDLATVRRYPFLGNWPVNGYIPELDPWKKNDFAAYRREFYRATLELLSRAGGQFRLDGAFVWSVGSFDVFGVHPVSSSAKGTFADSHIMAMIKQHNGMR